MGRVRPSPPAEENGNVAVVVMAIRLVVEIRRIALFSGSSKMQLILVIKIVIATAMIVILISTLKVLKKFLISDYFYVRLSWGLELVKRWCF
jgi:hypothetical protein